MSEPVFVVLVNFNRSSDTIEALESLLRSDYQPLRILVVDNGSEDGSVQTLSAWAEGVHHITPAPSERLRALSWPAVPKPIEYRVIAVTSPNNVSDGLPRLTILDTGKNLGFAGGNNAAMRRVLQLTTDGYVCLVNNDMVVAPNAITELVRAAKQDTTLGAVGGVILDYARPDEVQSVGGGTLSRLGRSEMNGAGLCRDDVSQPASMGYVSGGLILLPVPTLRRVGLMDERFFLYAEDADWGERLRQYGYRLGCALDSIAWHKGTQTIVARSPFQDYHVVRSTLLYVRKHTPFFTPVAVAYSLVRSLLPKVVRGQWKRAAAVLRAYADLARGR